MGDLGINERFTGEGREALLMVERSEALQALASFFKEWGPRDRSLTFNLSPMGHGRDTLVDPSEEVDPTELDPEIDTDSDPDPDEDEEFPDEDEEDSEGE